MTKLRLVTPTGTTSAVVLLVPGGKLVVWHAGSGNGANALRSAVVAFGSSRSGTASERMAHDPPSS